MTLEIVSKVFNFIRGAVRGINGYEDFSNINFLIVGVEGPGKELTKWLGSTPGASIFFTNDPLYALRQYQEVLKIDPSARYWEEKDCVDIVIDNLKEKIIIRGKMFSFEDLVEDSYTQGIHEFYL